MIADRGAWQRWAPMLLAIAVAAWFNSWVLAPQHFFFADDWGWLERAAFLPWREGLHLLPTSIYNDRPGGEAIIRIMYAVSGLRAGPYNLLWFLIHLFNCGLFFAIVSCYLPPTRALLATLLAGCWFSTLTAVHWIGAIFDLAGATWCLLALYLYIRSTGVERNAWLPAVGAFIFHFLAIRTKELALALIAVLAAWEFLMIRGASTPVRLRRLLPHILLSLAFLTLYAKLYVNGKKMLDSGAYAVSFSPSEIVQGIGYYFAQAFYAFVPGSNETNVAVGLVFAVLVVVLVATNRFGIVSLISAAALCAAVLLLTKQRHPLYLYVPHFFIAAALCSVAVKSRSATWITAGVVVALIAWPIHTGYWRDAKNFVLIKGGYSQTLFYDYANLMRTAPAPKRVRIAVAETYFDPFSWGEGGAVKLYHGSLDIGVEVATLPESNATCEASQICLVEVKGRLRRSAPANAESTQ